MSNRSFWRLLTTSLLGLALVVGWTAPAQAQAKSNFPARIALPDGFLPEGIAIGPGHQAFFGSRGDGSIYRVNLRTGQGSIISKGPGTMSVGLKSDQRGRLFVAGGGTGDGRVVSTRTGKILTTYQFTTKESFVNDVVLTRSKAWFTDSRQAQLYSVRRSHNGKPAPTNQFRTLPLSGDWVQTSGTNNANGISTTPDHAALLVVQSNTGFLFRVNPHTGRTTRVDLGTTLLKNGDGLLRQGRILYAVQNADNKVAVIKLSRAGTRGRLIDTLTSPDFDVPTTIAAYGRSLYLPNARFSTPPTPDTEYWVTRIRRY
jgi:sugar lactone lactonase YvrE